MQKEEKGNYLSIGEFAKRSGIKRKTLIYYDQIDLLKPRVVHSNGYRYYHYHQLYTVNMIHFFKEIGMSLEEIKEYNKMKAASQISDLIQRQREEARQKQMFYRRMEQMLDLQLQTLEETEMFEEKKISVKYSDEVPLFFSSHVKCFYEGARSRFSVSLNDFYQECIAAGYEFPYPSGMLVMSEGKQEIRASETKYYIKIPESADFRPEGNYLTCYSRGVFDYEEGYRKLLAFAAERNLSLKGNLYVDFIQNELVAPNFDDFILKMMIKVK
ncbi:MerR family transcriptional regulator [Enterococcus sp. BWT-B8]|uniref:MerR family transcriptional regulator n=1 Tax=unclassified Enterococcus TaxID=2608891 RepID=UPI001E5EC6C9|nr:MULTISPECIES: MerR family transcriptional regulator [unclassified Enterococcus]MCB5951208.1 MerR family transcriptional regulator [Enterococcus sp. BWT-B8]MCB5954848.1 MerR family transcriptional regulator [Enterococcus sp. CWB-B31]